MGGTEVVLLDPAVGLGWAEQDTAGLGQLLLTDHADRRDHTSTVGNVCHQASCS
jgi:hypothetical protein